jgi:hypothetical protein
MRFELLHSANTYVHPWVHEKDDRFIVGLLQHKSHNAVLRQGGDRADLRFLV